MTKRLIAIALFLVLAGCESASVPSCAPYQDPGPWAAGVTTLDVSGNVVEVWYPARHADVEGRTPDVYDARTFLPPDLIPMIPADAHTTLSTLAYRDVPVADARFPIVYFSHGLGGFRLQSTAITAHLAQWGYVVVAPQHPERDMAAVLQGMIADNAYLQIVGAHARMRIENAPGGRFADRLDLERVALMGHSAGGGAVEALSDGSASGDNDLGIDAWIGMATVAAPRTATIPGLLIGGGEDGIAVPATMRSLFENELVASPARLVSIAGAGHLAFSDLCVIGRDQGGILQIAQDAGLELDPLVVMLANDGCQDTSLPAEQAWPVIRHYAVAHLRASLGAPDDGTTASGLEPDVTQCFGDLVTSSVRD